MLSTDKQTNRQTNATKNITSFAKEIITMYMKQRHIEKWKVQCVSKGWIRYHIVYNAYSLDVSVRSSDCKLQFTPWNENTEHTLWADSSHFRKIQCVFCSYSKSILFSNFCSTSYPSLVSEQRQHGLKSLPGTSTYMTSRIESQAF